MGGIGERVRNRNNLKRATVNNKKSAGKRYRIGHVEAINKVKQQGLTPTNNSLNYNDAIANNAHRTERDAYKLANEKEISQLELMNTWDVNNEIDRKKIDTSKIINTMFIFNTKRDGTRKCRLVARGDLQKSDTYDRDAEANTVHHQALIACLAYVLDNNKFVTQLDISSAYLYAELEEELYINPLPHMKDKSKVIRLNKSLYGLKQSGANWYKKISNHLIQNMDLIEVPGWPCVFHKSKLIICLFVDDVVVISNDIEDVNSFVNDI